MQRGMPMRWPSAGLLVALTSSCVPPYEPPTANQPHAVIKFRRTYDQTAGTRLSEMVDIDEHAALRESTHSSVAKAPRTDSILAHPVPGTFVVRSNFSHQEMRTVQESYQESHTTYRMESYSCGSGTSYRTCTRSAPHTEYRTKYRTVTKSVDVSDGSCSRALRFAPKDHHVYLLQYTYQAPSACQLSCFEQVQAGDGA